MVRAEQNENYKLLNFVINMEFSNVVHFILYDKLLQYVSQFHHDVLKVLKISNIEQKKIL